MLTVIDLFAGVGGLSLGAARAGFNVACAVELDEYAISTHAKNFPSSRHIMHDVGKLDGHTLLNLAGICKGELSGLIGGPPCQGFSVMGKRDLSDLRNDLFVHFFRLVSETLPAFFLAENVPGISSSCYDDLREQAFSLVRDHYVLLDPIEVKADRYGAPTSRTRIFFIGYDQARVREFTKESLHPGADIQAVVVAQALSGLPKFIDPSWQKEESGWQPVGNSTADWFGERVMNMVPKGIGDPRSLERFFEKHQVSGCLGTLHTSAIIERYASLAWGETDPVSRSTRLHPAGLCPTIRAGTAKDRGSYQAVRPIHYAYPRVITPREAARLQGFPDWFIFHPTKWHSFRQLGNSVSPLVAERLLHVIRTHLYS